MFYLKAPGLHYFDFAKPKWNRKAIQKLEISMTRKLTLPRLSTASRVATSKSPVDDLWCVLVASSILKPSFEKLRNYENQFRVESKHSVLKDMKKRLSVLRWPLNCANKEAIRVTLRMSRLVLLESSKNFFGFGTFSQITSEWINHGARWENLNVVYHW